VSHAQERVVVTRGDRFDVAEWSPGEPTWFGSAAQVYRPSRAPTIFALAASILAIVGTAILLHAEAPALRRPLVPTVADIGAVHAGVTAAGVPVRRTQRLAGGDAVETDETGRARVRLDDGTAVVVDRSTRLSVREGALALDHGRVFVQAAAANGARTAIDLGAATAIASGADIGVERTAGGAKVYVANAEITVRAEGGAETTVRAGDTATVSGGKVTVAP
jgi:ferric-dicitrate binding protein FerR (iron transport regulator)